MDQWRGKVATGALLLLSCVIMLHVSFMFYKYRTYSRIFLNSADTRFFEYLARVLDSTEGKYLLPGLSTRLLSNFFLGIFFMPPPPLLVN